MRELETRKIEYNLVFTDQHKVTTDELLSDFGILQSRGFPTMEKQQGAVHKHFQGGLCKFASIVW